MPSPNKWYRDPRRLAGSVRDREPRLPEPRHLPGSLGQPVPPRGGVHPALVLARCAARACWRRLLLGERWGWAAVWRDVGHLVGWCAIAIGLVGVVLHLDSRFFHERTIKSLVYAAPFAAPLAYTGLGLLLVMNRMVDPTVGGVAALGAAAGPGRRRRQLRLQPDRPRPERLLPLDGMDPRRQQCLRRRLPDDDLPHAGDATVPRAVRDWSCWSRWRSGCSASPCTPAPTCADRRPSGSTTSSSAPRLCPDAASQSLALLCGLGLWVLRTHLPASQTALPAAPVSQGSP